MSYTNTYQRINWQNLPSEATALNDVNLNKMDAEIYAHGEQFETVDTALGHKVDKESGKGLSTIKTLSISTSANTGTNIASISYKDQNNLTVGYTIKNGVVVDSALSSSSENPVQNKVVKSAIDAKSTVSISDTLVTGDTIANLTINGTTTAIKAPLVEVDDELSTSSTNPVQNKIITEALREIMPEETVTGNPISITDGSNVVPAKQAEVTLLPIQDLSQGDPSPTNICPISGRNSVEVKRTGKNQFDGANETGKRVRITDGLLENQGDMSASGFIRVFPNTNYTFNFSYFSVGNYGMSFYDANKTFISGIKQGTGTNLNPFTFATPNYCSYIRFSIPNAIILPNEIQLELGSTATTYEPYQGETYTETLGQTVYGGKVDFVSGVLTVDKIYKQITRAGGSSPYDWNDKHGVVFNSVLDSNYARVDGICTHGTVSTVSTGTEPGQLWLGVGNKSVYWIGILDVLGLSISDFNTWIDNNSVYICYPLATPTEITLTAEQISLLKGNNVLVSDSNGNIKLTYSADIKAFIENQLSNS